MYIVKIGGSLITDKNSYCKPDYKAINEYAKVIKEHWELLEGNLIIVLGGGSYGNAVPKKYNIHNSKEHWKPEDVAMMTVKMQEWLHEFYYIFKNYGIPCYPFQSSAFLTSLNGKCSTSYAEPIKKSIKLGLLPIIAGDLVFDDTEKFVIYSSDKIPEALVKHMPVKKVIMLTDVPGVYYPNNTNEIIKKINRQNFNVVLAETSGSLKQDVTGGMKTKVQSLFNLALNGYHSVICDGKDPENIINVIMERKAVGTVIEG